MQPFCEALQPILPISLRTLFRLTLNPFFMSRLVFPHSSVFYPPLASPQGKKLRTHYIKTLTSMYGFGSDELRTFMQAFLLYAAL